MQFEIAKTPIWKILEFHYGGVILSARRGIAQCLSIRMCQAAMRNSLRVALFTITWNIWHAADPFEGV
jgi:hypothetical protein